MTRDRRTQLDTLRIVGCSAGLSVPLLCCATFAAVELTGVLPAFATGAMPVVLLGVATAVGCWVWAQSAELG